MKTSTVIKLVRPDNQLVIVIDSGKPDQPLVTRDNAGVLIDWGSGGNCEYYPWHRVDSIRSSRTP